MGRQPRPYLPGAIFHLTARTIRGERWLTPSLRSRALRLLAEAMPRSGARLLAVAIMANHLHLVVQQGEKELSHLMHPFLRRLAHALQKAHDLRGPVFWRPYGCQACMDPAYARNAIAYTHLNPVRAGLCDDVSGYDWTSHALYAGTAEGVSAVLEPIFPILDCSLALPLFATGRWRSMAELRADYRGFLERRMGPDLEHPGNGRGSADGSARPRAIEAGATGAWAADLSPLFHSPRRSRNEGSQHLLPATRPNMHAIAAATLAMEAPGVTLAMIRGRGGGLERSRARRKISRRLRAVGFRNNQIARFLGLSESGVSYLLHSPDPSD